MVSRRSEEHTSELQSHSEISYAVFCLKKKKRGPLVQPVDGSVVLSTSVILDGVEAVDDLPGLRLPVGVVVPQEPFFFNDPAPTEIYTLSYTLSLHDALPISTCSRRRNWSCSPASPRSSSSPGGGARSEEHTSELQSHSEISYAVFCLKK